MKGSFTLPGEAGYEKLTLKLADLWGADCIRDSDGTALSEEILSSGVPIYSTVCLIRSINDWAKEHMNCLQRNFLISKPVPAENGSAKIKPLEGYFSGQFVINPEDGTKYWQVFDRTSGQEHADWDWDGETVTVNDAADYHYYTVTFLATRVWEEISMYNHVTNDWGDREHLMAVEPRYPETQEALLSFLDGWLKNHPHTDVVRLTSMFYNFTWIWGSSGRLRDVFSDWGSYDFTVNPVALTEFEKEYGYKMTGEDFINAGKHNPTHNPPTEKIRDWIEFTGKFVRSFGKKCVDLIHSYGKKAYVFYDDSWIGIEPWSGHFGEFGFDGLIKCVFNAFEARLCAGVKEVKTHELRLHPYLFPTGLGGEPTFLPGGRPEKDARGYWLKIRRALMRVKLDRIGLGGYLHLTEDFPAFQQEIKRIADEFRLIKSLHENGEPWNTGIRIGILQSWGSLRTWNCAGHMHEHPELPLNHIHESLAGLPVELKSVRLEEVAKNGVPEDIDVLINAGREGDAWSGGEIWKNADLKANITKFVFDGGGFIGVKEPGCTRGGMRNFALADLMGVDIENGDTICAGKYAFETVKDHFITRDIEKEPAFHNASTGVYALDGETQVLLSNGEDVVLSAKQNKKGRGVYLNGYSYCPENTRLLFRAILWAAGKEEMADLYICSDPACECAYFEKSGILAVINDTDEEKTVDVFTPEGVKRVDIAPAGIALVR